MGRVQKVDRFRSIDRWVKKKIMEYIINAYNYVFIIYTHTYIYIYTYI